jgi:hypothetical protein
MKRSKLSAQPIKMGAVQSRSDTRSAIVGSEKVIGIQLPGQSGKTRKMEEKIAEYMRITRNDNGADDLNIMISSNSKLLVSQTTSRLNSDLGPELGDDSDSINTDSDAEDDGAEYAVLRNGADTWTSSAKREPMELVLDIIDDIVSMIVCCANAARFKKLLKVLERLQQSKHFKRKINIWIDEAHKCIKLLLKSKFNYVIALSKIARVTLVTASWDPIDKYFNIPRIPYEHTHPDVYRSLHECEWRIVEPLVPDDNESVDEAGPFDMSTSAPGYIQQIFNNPELLPIIEAPGKHWLIPGNSRTATHDAICDFLFSRGWAGLKLNGKEKFLTIQLNRMVIEYNKYNERKEEPKDVLARLFREFPELGEVPFFITGLNCIKEGITFQGEHFMLDGAILPNVASPSDAYQLACRLAGNLKGLSIYARYAKPLIITTSRMEKKIKKQENIAIYLPRILYEEGRTVPTQFDKNRAARGKVAHDIRGKGYRVFKNYEHFKGYANLIDKKTTFREHPDPEDEHYPFHAASVQSTRGGARKPRYLTEVIDKVEHAYGGGGGMKTGTPCYLDIALIDTLVWVVYIHDVPGIDRFVANADRIYPDEAKTWEPLAKNYTE